MRVCKSQFLTTAKEYVWIMLLIDLNCGVLYIEVWRTQNTSYVWKEKMQKRLNCAQVCPRSHRREHFPIWMFCHQCFALFLAKLKRIRSSKYSSAEESCTLAKINWRQMPRPPRPMIVPVDQTVVKMNSVLNSMVVLGWKLNLKAFCDTYLVCCFALCEVQWHSCTARGKKKKELWEQVDRLHPNNET